MKTKIKVKVFTPECTPKINEKGDWIDLRSAVDIDIKAAQSGTLKKKDNAKYRNIRTDVHYIPLGVAIKLPKGYEAIVTSRSGTPKKIGLFIPSGQGIIDNCYNGENDQWMFVCSPLRETIIHKGDRICQFRVQLSQKATVWHKIKWLFSTGIKLEYVDNLENNSRGMNITGIE